MALPVVPIAITDSESEIRSKLGTFAAELNALGGGGGSTNLSYTPSPTNGIVVSDTGNDATIPLATTTNAGLISPDEKKLVVFSETRFVGLHTDFMNSATFGPFGLSVFSGGTITGQNALNNRLGIQALRDSTTASGGVHVGTGATSILLAGQEVFQHSFQWKDTRTTSIARIGFFNGVSGAYSATAPPNGAFFELIGTATGFTMSAKTSDNSTVSTTPTPSEDFTGTTDTWYTLEVLVNTNATQITFSVYEDPSDTSVWTKTISTNIPTATSRTVGAGVLVYETTTSAAAAILHADWMRFFVPRTLAR